MNNVVRLVACGLALVVAAAARPATHEVAIPPSLQQVPLTRRVLPPGQVQRELGKLLSSGSSIFGPSDPSYAEATVRWNTFDKPDIQVVVEVAKESDVPIVQGELCPDLTPVKYCNDNSIDFLAYNRGHGATSSLAKLKGLEINLSRLRDITIQPNGKSAWFQGGTYGEIVIDQLWRKGYVTTTGSNGCVGLLGPGLGGGLGRYQGLYGLISDNFINLNVVLADGSTVRVNQTSHKDLFWAMKGAGHNFGIVTSAELKIYPRKLDTWHYHNYVWAQDKLEAVFEALNKFQGKGKIPALMGVNFGQISLVPSINATQAVLSWTFAYAGPSADAERLLKPFNDIEAIQTDSGDVSYPQLLVAQGTDAKSPSCAPNPLAGATVHMQTYNVTAQRQVYNLFNKQVAEHPQLAAAARVYYEGYASGATQDIDAASSAYAHRDEYLLVFFATVVPKGQRCIAQDWAKQVRALWIAGQPGRRPATYVNYASGDESLESVYGYESWRLQRLRSLKTKFDPHNRFRFFEPLVS